MLTIHVLTYNEEIILPFFIKHYRNKFPNCIIKIYDNESTDNTIEIAKKNNCEIISYSTNNQLSDEKYLEIKNNVWKKSNTDWNLICDVDEFCMIDEEILNQEESIGTTIIKFTAFDMINKSNNPNDIEIEGIEFGIRNNRYDKDLIFNKKFIKEINYEPGCHTNKVIGVIKYSTNSYKLLHYKYIGENFIINRYQNFLKRMSPKNIREGWGVQYLTSENELRLLYKNKQNESIKIEF